MIGLALAAALARSNFVFVMFGQSQPKGVNVKFIAT